MENNIEEEKYRSKVVSLLTTLNYFCVAWFGHFKNTIHVFEIGKTTKDGIKPNVYSAMFEAFYDLVEGSREIAVLDIDEEMSWRKMYSKLQCFEHNSGLD